MSKSEKKVKIGQRMIRVIQEGFGDMEMPKDWRKPLVPFICSADTGLYPISDSDKYPDWTIDAEKLIVKLVGDKRATVEVCLNMNPPLEKLVGFRAFRTGIEAMMKVATVSPRNKPSGCLGYYLYGCQPMIELPEHLAGHQRLGMEYWSTKDQFISDAVKSVLNNLSILPPDLFDPSMLLPGMREGMYWRHFAPTQDRLATRMMMPVIAVLDRYVDAVMASDTEAMNVVAPWLRIFSVALPIGQLKEKPNVWLFYRPQ